jgi:hypothetical protein
MTVYGQHSKKEADTHIAAGVVYPGNDLGIKGVREGNQTRLRLDHHPNRAKTLVYSADSVGGWDVP